jgi:hypothetical protein
VVQDFAGPKEAAKAIDELDIEGNYTVLNEAMAQAALKASEGLLISKAAVIVTDSASNLGAAPEEAIASIQEIGVPIHLVGFGTKIAADRAEEMKTLSRALSAETLKMKRTLALWLTLLTPAALVFLEVAGATQQQGNLSSLSPDINRWSLLFEELLSIWVILIFPLFITLETALLGQLEHGNNTWKLTHTQPVPRWATLAAKQIWGLGLITLGMVALIGLTLVGGTVLDILMPELKIEPPIPWADIFQQTGIALLAGGIILGIHTWIAYRAQSFVVSSAIGISMTIAGLILRGLDWAEYFPWSMPAAALYKYYEGTAVTSYLVIGMLGWLVFTLLGNLNVSRLEITN